MENDKKKDKKFHVNLFSIKDETNHFAWIKNLSRLLSSQVSKSKKKCFSVNFVQNIQL